MFTLETKTEFILILLCLTIIFTVIINLVLLLSVALLRKEKLNISKPTISSLSTVSLLTAVSYQPILISFILQSANSVERANISIDWRILCKILSALERETIVTITWSLTAACLDKYMHLFQITAGRVSAIRYKVTTKFSVVIVFTAWITGTLFGVFSYLLTEYKESNGSHSCYMSLEFYGIYQLVYCAAFITLGFIIPSIVMILLYSYTTKQLFIHKTVMSKNPFQNSRSNHRSKSTLNGKVKDSKLLVIHVILFLLTVTPYFVMTLILSTGHWSSIEFPNSVYISFVLLLHTNCCISPLLCGFSNERIRLVLVDTIKQRMVLWLRCERQVRGEAAEEISFISADCSLIERSLSVTSRTSIVSQESLTGQMDMK